jgi:hypothetical protein
MTNCPYCKKPFVYSHHCHVKNRVVYSPSDNDVATAEYDWVHRMTWGALSTTHDCSPTENSSGCDSYDAGSSDSGGGCDCSSD